MVAGRKIPDEIIDNIIIDWRTGEYKIKHLASKYKVSVGKIHQVVVGVEQDLNEIVNAGSVYKQAIAKNPEKIVHSINEAVDYRVRVAGLANTFVEKAIMKATQMLEITEDAQSVKALADAVDKNTITAGVNERHAKPTQITNQVANFGALTDEDLHREAKIVRERLTQIVE